MDGNNSSRHQKMDAQQGSGGSRVVRVIAQPSKAQSGNVQQPQPVQVQQQTQQPQPVQVQQPQSQPEQQSLQQPQPVQAQSGNVQQPQPVQVQQQTQQPQPVQVQSGNVQQPQPQQQQPQPRPDNPEPSGQQPPPEQPHADSGRAKIGLQMPIGAYGKRDKKKRRKDKGSGNILINSAQLPFQYKEAFHFLRTNIKFLSASRECKKIVVTSSIPGEGKTTIAINLALSLSAANNSVVLVDADLRKPAIHDYLMISEDTTMGLTDALQDMVDVRTSVRNKVDRKSLYVIPSGMIPPNPTELLGSQRMDALLATLGEFFDYVILDTPPVSVVTDAAMLSQYVDGVLLVVRQKMPSFDQAKIAKKNLEAVGAKILGVVLNDFDRKHLDRESGYYYNYRRYGKYY